MHHGCMSSFDRWQEQRRLADVQASAAAHDLEATLTDLGHGMWLVSRAGVTRGTVTEVFVRDETRYQARLRHLNPGQGVMIGQYWELDRAVEAILAEAPKTPGRDPFRQLTNYASREQMREREERLRQRRRARRYG